MKKILFCASTVSHIKNFHLPYIKALSDSGYEVYTAADSEFLFENTKGCFMLPFKKVFTSPQNVKAIFAARKLLLEHRFDAVSLHTTLAAAVVRAAILTLPPKLRPKVFYICHGYLFNENDGAGSLKYLIPEKLCAPVTDVLMVMNREDERIAKNHRLYGGELIYINGMGLPDGKFSPPSYERHILAKKAFGFSPEDRLFICCAELSERKNQELLIRAFAEALPVIPTGYLLLAGKGRELERYQLLCQKLGLQDRVRFLGYVTDMPTLLDAADGFVSASRIEGLPFAVMEALTCGLPAALSDIKGHRELAKTGETAWLFSDEEQLAELIKRIYALPQLRYDYELSPFMLSEVSPYISAIYLNEQTETGKVGTLL